MSRATIITLTPVHVGSGKNYQHKIEYFTENNFVYIIDPEKLFYKISSDIDLWIDLINKGESIKNFIKNKRIDFQSIALRVCKLKSKIKKDKELHEQIFSSIKGFYIPGSSIKGAIKSCLLSYLASDCKLIDEIVINDLKNDKKNWSDKKIDDKFFGDGTNKKLTRFIKVGDAYFGDIETNVYYSEALNADKNCWIVNKGIANLYEAIPENKEAYFEMNFDDQLLRLNLQYLSNQFTSEPFMKFKNNFSVLPKVVNNETKKAIERELNFFDMFQLPQEGEFYIKELKKILAIIEACNKNEFVVRVGSNSGYNFITYKWFDDLPAFKSFYGKDEYKNLRKEVQKNRFHKDYTNENFWPRTRKIASGGIPFGFVKISIIDDGIDVDAKRVKGSLIQEEKKPRENGRKAPDYYTGTIKQGTEGIPAMVIESGKPNKVKLLIKDNEVILPLQKYFSPIEYGTFVYVRVVEFSKNVIKTVSYQKHYE